jgi:hypothetical protein
MVTPHENNFSSTVHWCNIHYCLYLVGTRLRTIDFIHFVSCVCNPFTDFDGIELPSSVTVPEMSSSSGFYVTGDDGVVTMSEQHFAELQQMIHHLTLQVTNIFPAFVGSIMQAFKNVK